MDGLLFITQAALAKVNAREHQGSDQAQTDYRNDND